MGEASLVYSKGNSIQRMSLPPRPNNVGVIYQHAGAVHVGVDYDCVDQKVYWTEVMEGVIRRAKYDGSEVEVILNGGKTSSPEGEGMEGLVSLKTVKDQLMHSSCSSFSEGLF